MRILLAAASFALALTAPAMAETCGNTGQGFDAFVSSMKAEAKAQGVSDKSVRALDAVNYDPAIIKRDRAQNIFSDSFLDFQKKMISSYRLKQGQALIQKHKSLFDRIENEFGVPAAVIVSFWALETDFGATTGDYDTIQALATLAWDCRRPEKFRPQLIASLQLLDRGDLRRDEFKGAWAGEIGQTQFMAYDYLESAVDYDGDGKRDLRNSVPDVLASTANLLRKHGWQPGQPWMQEVKITQDLPWEEADIAIQHPRSQWAQWGIVTIGGKPIKADNMQASLHLPMGRNGPAFLVYENFTAAYLKWNESLIYSTTTAYLATRIAGAAPVSRGRAPVEHLSYDQIRLLQQKLQDQGYDVGKIDGKIGAGTRAAVKDQQLKLGLPADSYPTEELIEKVGTGSKKVTKKKAKPATTQPQQGGEEGNNLY